MSISLVLVVQSNLLTVRQLSQLRMMQNQDEETFSAHPHLGDLLEPKLISGELVGEAGRLCCKLLGHVPHTISKLKITKR